MSKTFKSIAPGSSATIEVAATDGNVTLYVRQNIGAIDLSANDAPAIALAILEAAGHRPVAYDPERLSGDDLLAYIAHRLAVHVSDESKRTKEAADREALEHEAEALYLAGCETLAASAAGHTTIAWDDLSGRTQDAHLSVARKARELHNR